MASKLDVDEIAAKNGTDPVTLTKQEAAKCLLGYNLASSAHLIPANSASVENLNISSVTDSSTGEFYGSVTNAFNTDEWIIAGATSFDNNNLSVAYTSSTASKVSLQTRDADSSSVLDTSGYAIVHGDLA